jgi:hypothetical protein
MAYDTRLVKIMLKFYKGYGYNEFIVDNIKATNVMSCVIIRVRLLISLIR